MNGTKRWFVGVGGSFNNFAVGLSFRFEPGQSMAIVLLVGPFLISAGRTIGTTLPFLGKPEVLWCFYSE